jgi:hypothetical protein
VIEEHYTSVLVMPSLEVGPPTDYVRLGLGIGHHVYGGRESIVSSDTGPAASIAVGRCRHRWGAELFVRGSVSGDFELSYTVVGAQVVLRLR